MDYRQVEVDVLYVSNRELYPLIKRYTEDNSISMTFYRAVGEIFEIKKTIWNIIDRTKKSGYICVECCPENISLVISSIANNPSFYYSTVYFVSEYEVYSYIIMYFNKVYEPKLPIYYNVIRNDDIPGILIDFIGYKENVLLVGNDASTFISTVKNKGRYVIAMCNNNKNIIHYARSEGLSVLNA